MKKYFGLILAVAIALGASACKSESSSGIADIAVEASEISEAPKHNNVRIDYTNEEVIEIIESTRFKASEDIFTDVPKSIDHVSTFYCGTTAQLSVKDSVENFRAAFSYLFPNHEFDEDCFFTSGRTPKKGTTKRFLKITTRL